MNNLGAQTDPEGKVRGPPKKLHFLFIQSLLNRYIGKVIFLQEFANTNW